jgi:photosystem II stability/assembly factor-like uncharacterized protein
MKLFSATLLLIGLCDSIACGQWKQQTINSNADFRGLSVVSANAAWLGGTKGTYARTSDGGETWIVRTVPGAEKLDFRDVQAFSDTTAYLLSAGPGDDSRIYKTTDGGNFWILQFVNSDKKGFFDAIAFWDEKNGIALGDPVDGQFQLIVTDDAGANWKKPPGRNLPPALPKEGAFAASGTCLMTYGQSDVWFCTGGAQSARIFHSSDRGNSWSISNTPIVAGTESAGIFSVAFRDQRHGMVVGGDYRKPKEPGANAATTADGGRTWTLLDRPFAYRSCVAWAKDRWVAVGTSGSDISADDGASWRPLDQENYNCVAFAATGDGWSVGPRGRVAKFIR